MRFHENINDCNHGGCGGSERGVDATELSILASYGVQTEKIAQIIYTKFGDTGKVRLSNRKQR